jgi:hypothetical protein
LNISFIAELNDLPDETQEYFVSVSLGKSLWYVGQLSGTPASFVSDLVFFLAYRPQVTGVMVSRYYRSLAFAALPCSIDTVGRKAYMTLSFSPPNSTFNGPITLTLTPFFSTVRISQQASFGVPFNVSSSDQNAIDSLAVVEFPNANLQYAQALYFTFNLPKISHA